LVSKRWFSKAPEVELLEYLTAFAAHPIAGKSAEFSIPSMLIVLD
jgi:hypothetical protein